MRGKNVNNNEYICVCVDARMCFHAHFLKPHFHLSAIVHCKFFHRIPKFLRCYLSKKERHQNQLAAYSQVMWAVIRNSGNIPHDNEKFFIRFIFEFGLVPQEKCVSV